MARQVHEREDLLRDAKALVQRVELEIVFEERSMTLFAGFRSQGAASIYFGSDPVYHFTSTGLLRRAFVDGRLVKAERERLIQWTRRHANQQVEMLRYELTAVEQQHFLNSLTNRLDVLKRSLDAKEYTLLGQIPSEANILDQLQRWLASHPDFGIAQSPRVC